jgi:hypothetical protein
MGGDAVILRERLFVLLAVTASLLLHALVFGALRNVQFDISRQRLFATRSAPDRPIVVTRSANDLIVEDVAPTPQPLDIDNPLGDRDAINRLALERLKTIVPEHVPKALDPADGEPLDAGAQETDPAKLIEPAEATVDRNIDPAQLLDATLEMMRLSLPSIALPEYSAATDDVVAPPPIDVPVAPPSMVDVSKLDNIKALESDPLAVVAAPGGLLRDADRGPTPGGVSFGPPPGPAPIPETRQGFGVNPRTAGARPGGTAGATGASPTTASRTSPGAPNPRTTSPGATAPATLPELTPVPIEQMTLPDVLAESLLPQEPAVRPIVHLDNDFDYRLTTFDGPITQSGGLLGLFGQRRQQPAPTGPAYFNVNITPRKSLVRLKALKKDVVWVIDTSESIKPDWVDAIKRGVSLALDTLNEGDRFNIVMFKDTVSVLSGAGLLTNSLANRETALKFLGAAEASGYTDVNRALGRLIVRDTPPDRVYQIVLITDGKPTRGAIDARQIINLITRENDMVAGIYCVGVGADQDRQLLEFLAYRNKGRVTYPENVRACATSIRGLASRLRYPILKDATYDAVGIDTRAVYPRIPRDIYQNEPIDLFGRFTQQDRSVSLRLTGSNAEDIYDFTFTLNFAQAVSGEESIAMDWAFWKLHQLYSEVIRQGPTPELQEQMNQIKRDYGLKTAY